VREDVKKVTYNVTTQGNQRNTASHGFEEVRNDLTDAKNDLHVLMQNRICKAEDRNINPYCFKMVYDKKGHKKSWRNITDKRQNSSIQYCVRFNADSRKVDVCQTACKSEDRNDMWTCCVRFHTDLRFKGPA
jgi:hypothetical protein